MSDYERGRYRGKRVFSEADREWADKPDDECVPLPWSGWRRRHPSFANVPEEGDSSLPSEVEKNLHPESEW